MPKRKKGKSKTPNQILWEKEKSRIQHFMRRAEKRGFKFDVTLPTKPKRITKQAIEKLKAMTPATLYKQAEYERGGVKMSGEQGRAMERRVAAQKAKHTREELAKWKKRIEEYQKKQDEMQTSGRHGGPQYPEDSTQEGPSDGITNVVIVDGQVIDAETGEVLLDELTDVTLPADEVTESVLQEIEEILFNREYSKDPAFREKMGRWYHLLLRLLGRERLAQIMFEAYESETPGDSIYRAMYYKEAFEAFTWRHMMKLVDAGIMDIQLAREFMEEFDGNQDAGFEGL